ncbi:MAG: PhoU family transcriptional regulator [Candidatus Bathyarchaeota archaeon]|nr:MAG: PhoU family transcriptional regulator [Candidatus Bathyarchaeota archaeon]
MASTRKLFKNIANKLAELKDTSELMMDIAYSSILLNSRELAEEVQELEKHIDELHTQFELLVLSSGFKPEESRDFLGLIRLGVVTERIADAAAEISDVVLRGLEPHPVLKLVIKEAEETVTRAQVAKKSSFVGKNLRDCRIPEETGMWVLVIRRGKKWLRPKPDSMVRAGDLLIASGYKEGEEDLRKLASGETLLSVV